MPRSIGREITRKRGAKPGCHSWNSSVIYFLHWYYSAPGKKNVFWKPNARHWARFSRHWFFFTSCTRTTPPSARAHGLIVRGSVRVLVCAQPTITSFHTWEPRRSFLFFLQPWRATRNQENSSRGIAAAIYSAKLSIKAAMKSAFSWPFEFWKSGNKREQLRALMKEVGHLSTFWAYLCSYFYSSLNYWLLMRVILARRRRLFQ